MSPKCKCWKTQTSPKLDISNLPNGSVPTRSPGLVPIYRNGLPGHGLSDSSYKGTSAKCTGTEKLNLSRCADSSTNSKTIQTIIYNNNNKKSVVMCDVSCVPRHLSHDTWVAGTAGQNWFWRILKVAPIFHYVDLVTLCGHKLRADRADRSL